MNKTFKRAKHIIVKNLGEVQSINVEPNWEGLYRFMMHLKKGDNAAFVRVTRKMGNDWEKLVAMAQKKKWQIESVKEAIGSGATPEQMHKNLSTALKGAGFKVKKFEKMKWGFGGVWGGFYHVQDKREKDGKSVMPFHVKKDGKKK